MKLVVIDLNLSPRQKAVLRWSVVGATAVSALGLAVANAAPKHSFAPGGTVLASEMNDNFNDLDARLAALEGRSGKVSASYSNNATYCGATANL